MRPHRRQLTRLPHHWDPPGKNTGVGCHFLLQCMKVKSEREVAHSCLALSNPMDCSLTGSSIHRILQARILEWSAIAFSVKISLVFPILLFSSISLHWSLRKAFLSLLAILWNFAFTCLYLSFSPSLFTSLLYTAICKASPDSHFAFLHFFSMGMILIPVSCTMSLTSVHSSSGTLLSILFLSCSAPGINLQMYVWEKHQMISDPSLWDALADQVKHIRLPHHALQNPQAKWMIIFHNKVFG